MRQLCAVLLLTGFLVALSGGCSNKGSETPKTQVGGEVKANPDEKATKGPTLPPPPDAKP